MQKDAPSEPGKFTNIRKMLCEQYASYQNVRSAYKAGEMGPKSICQLQDLVGEICATYVKAKADGENVEFPPQLAAELAFIFGDLAKGHQHDLVRPKRDRRRPPTSFSVELAEETAVRYVQAVRKGWVEDPHPVKTVVNAFQISDATWRRWRKKHQNVSTADVRATRALGRWVQDFLLEHPGTDVYLAMDHFWELKGKKIKDLMEFAARHYPTLPGAYSWKAIEKRARAK